MALTKNLQAIKNKWRIENLYYKNWRNEPHSAPNNRMRF